MSYAENSIYNYDYEKLYKRIREMFGTQAEFAKALGIGRTSLNLKLNNNVEFTQNEILIGARLLKVPATEIPDYFFETML